MPNRFTTRIAFVALLPICVGAAESAPPAGRTELARIREPAELKDMPTPTPIPIPPPAVDVALLKVLQF